MRARLLLIPAVAVLLPCVGCSDDGERHQAGDMLGDYPLRGAGDLRARTSEFGSRVLLIHFFETDSDECRDQVGRIKSLWFPRRAAGMSVLAVCPDAEEQEVARVVEDWNPVYPVFPDPEREFARRFAPRKYPWNVVVGRDGRILLTEKGSWDRVQAAVEEALRVKVDGSDHIRIQHLVIGFEGSVPGRKIERSKEDAAKLAAEVYERAKGGEDFEELVKAYTAGVLPGIHNLANFNVEIDDDIEEAERGNVAHSFGDVAFSLEVGGIGMAEYHPVKCRSGWIIIKRLD